MKFPTGCVTILATSVGVGMGGACKDRKSWRVAGSIESSCCNYDYSFDACWDEDEVDLVPVRNYVTWCPVWVSDTDTYPWTS